jgi:hypothetical protein
MRRVFQRIAGARLETLKFGNWSLCPRKEK